jgi:hypothetical protein
MSATDCDNQSPNKCNGTRSWTRTAKAAAHARFHQRTPAEAAKRCYPLCWHQCHPDPHLYLQRFALRALSGRRCQLDPADDFPVWTVCQRVPPLKALPSQPRTFSVWKKCTVPTDKRSEHPRGMLLVTRMQELQANMRGIQWHPRACISVEKRAPYTGAMHRISNAFSVAPPYKEQVDQVRWTRLASRAYCSNTAYRNQTVELCLQTAECRTQTVP